MRTPSDNWCEDNNSSRLSNTTRNSISAGTTQCGSVTCHGCNNFVICCSLKTTSSGQTQNVSVRSDVSLLGHYETWCLRPKSAMFLGSADGIVVTSGGSGREAPSRPQACSKNSTARRWARWESLQYLQWVLGKCCTAPTDWPSQITERFCYGVLVGSKVTAANWTTATDATGKTSGQTESTKKSIFILQRLCLISNQLNIID